MIIFHFFLKFIYLFQAVSHEDGEALAKEFNIHFFEASAKQDINVSNAFLTIATDVKTRLTADGAAAGPGAGGQKLSAGGAKGAAGGKGGGCC